MGWKSVFKGIWRGVQVAAPFLGVVPIAGPVGVIIAAISNAVIQAESMFPKQGTGVEKAQYVSYEALKVAEAVTGKNFNSPEGRQLVADVRDAEVAVRNAQALYAKCAEDLRKFTDAVKAPANPDDN